MNHTLAVYYEGKPIALHRLSLKKNDMVIEPKHYADIRIKDRTDMTNTLVAQGIGLEGMEPIPDLSHYDEVLYG